MSQTERIHQIVHILEVSRHPVPIERFLSELEISRATFKRDIEYLRDRLGAPIAWQRGGPGEPRGYYLSEKQTDGRDTFGIRGLWFNQSEIYALLMMHQLAGSMQPGLIPAESQALLTRITHLLGTADDDPQDVLSYIRILQSATKRQTSEWFQVVAAATVRRRRLRITYYTRSRNQVGEREVSPQRLLHYRENWYLLAWCHQVDDLRLFALDAFRGAELQNNKARVVARQRLDIAIGNGFGIFGGQADKRARLRFSAVASRWVVNETWHPRQTTDWEGEQLILEVPYAQSRELLMEILKHGADVEVLHPPELRAEAEQQIKEMLARYRSDG